MNPERDVQKRHPGELGQRSLALLSAGGLLVAACSLQDLDYLDYKYGLDGGLGGALNQSGAGGNAGRGGTGNSTAGMGGTAPGGTGGSSGGGAGGTGSAGIGGTGAGGTTGGGGAGGSAGTAPVNYGGSAGYLGTLGDGGPDGNIIPDPGFEDGIVGWTGVGAPTLTWTSVGPAAGTHCLRASGRSQLWMGPSYSLLGAVVPNETYNLSAYARLSHPDFVIKFTTKHVCQGSPDIIFTDVVSPVSATTSWSLYEGAFIVPTCTLTEYRIFAEEAPTGVDIFLDEVRIVPAP